MRKVLVKDITNELNEHIQNKIEETIYCIHDQPLVFVSKTNEINYEELEKSNVIVCPSQNFGGTIVASAGDMDMAIFKLNGWRVGSEFLKNIKEKFDKYIPNLSIDKNDLIAEGKYKLISYASVNAGDNLIYTCVHISFNPNVELINKICSKPMKKIPKSLKDYGLTTNMLEQILQEINID